MVTVPESPWVILSADGNLSEVPTGPVTGEGARMELEKNPCSPYLPALPLVLNFAFLRSLPRFPIAGPCHTSGGRIVTWCLGPRRQDLFQPWLSGHSAWHRVAEATP